MGTNNAEIVFLRFKKSTSKKCGINLLLKIVVKKTRKDNDIQSSRSFWARAYTSNFANIILQNIPNVTRKNIIC